MTCGIYRITEIETGRHYIGKSVNIERRWYAHRKRFPTDFFTYHIVLTCIRDENVLDSLERFCIAEFNGRLLGFNVTKGGSGFTGCKKGRYVSDETRQKMSEVMSGRKLSEEHRRKLSEAAQNRPAVSEETRQKLSEMRKGKPKSEEHRHKISQSRKRSLK